MKSRFVGSTGILCICLMLFALTGCKKPDSSYVLGKYEYAAGEMLLVENLSTNNKNTKWELFSPEGEMLQNTDAKNPGIILGIMYPDGLYRLKLTSYMRNEERYSVDEKPFLIKSIRTTLTVNQGGAGDHEEYTVYVDGQLIGESNWNGSFQAKLPIGQRIIRLVADNEEMTVTRVFEQGDWEYINF